MNPEGTNIPNAAGLIRGLTLLAASAIVVGAMIGQSVFLVASDMSRETGSQTMVLAAWVIGGAVVLAGAFCYGELGAAMPEAGGDYVYLSRGLSPFIGFLYGWTTAIITRTGSSATIAAGLLRLVGFLFPSVTAPNIFVGPPLSPASAPVPVHVHCRTTTGSGGHRARHRSQLSGSARRGPVSGVSDCYKNSDGRSDRRSRPGGE